MAVGWSKDGEVQQQIDSTVQEALDRVRRETPVGDGPELCEACGGTIPEARRKAVPSARLCIACQDERERHRE